MQPFGPHTIKRMSRDELAEFVSDTLRSLTEEETLAVIANPYVTPQLLGKIAQTQRLTGYYSVRLELVAHRQTPQAHATKLVHYLYWMDLVRLSVEVTIPAPVRRAIDTQLLNRVEKLSLGERVASARRCSHALIKHFLFDPHPRVFEALLVNKRLREDDLVALASSPHATPEKLTMLAADLKWSYRYAIRKALVLNPLTPRAAAASQLRYLSRVDLRHIHANPQTSVYLRRCIERIRPEDFSASVEGIE
ncbi:MAG: hypothetical protein JO197_23420 [Acidobacteria bacterium]|nr:hypothetical protein [Acidobacteriota bacterium]MBV9477841.1 hypothetical protein [Acidobacteriota bacterium]